MDFEQILSAIESHVGAWTDAPIAFDGAPTGPSVIAAQEAREPWIRLTVIDGASRTASIGDSPCTRRTGLISCQIFTDRDIGSRPARALASSLAAHIEHWQSGALQTHAASLVRVGPGDTWYQLNLNCGFRAG